MHSGAHFTSLLRGLAAEWHEYNVEAATFSTTIINFSLVESEIDGRSSAIEWK